MICTNCYYVGKSKTRGSLLLALFLLVIFFPIGLVYIVVMSVGNTNECPKCKSNKMIPEDSPRGKALARKYVQKQKKT